MPKMPTLIKGGRVIDPGHIDAVLDIFIADGKIAAIFEKGVKSSDDSDLRTRYPDARIIDASGKFVVPGLIDMHVHLREPGQEHKETIKTGCLAAAHGGFSAVCTMPNTLPVNDSRQVTELILKKADEAVGVRVYPVAAISFGLKGQRLCDFVGLKEAGAVAFTDDGNPVTGDRLMQEALEAAGKIGMPVISHSEDLGLTGNGVMNAGETAEKMGLPGIPNASESNMVIRDISLAELTVAHVHIAHVSTRESVQAIREAKQRGIRVTAETAPHYFTITDETVEKCGTNAKMNPPLRSARDREAVRQGLSDGTIDAIATDHAPHSVHEKALAFAEAPNGIIGLETAVPLALKLVDAGVLSMAGLVEKMSSNPARILGLTTGLRVGNPADITIIDSDISYTIESRRFRSLSKNTPFEGWNVTGKAVLTMAGGKVIYSGE